MGIKVIDRPGENQDREVERIGDRGRCGLRNGVHPRFYPDAKEPGGVRPYPALFTFVKMADSPNSLPESPTSWPTLAIPCRQWGGKALCTEMIGACMDPLSIHPFWSGVACMFER